MADNKSQVVKLDVPDKIPIVFQLGDKMIDSIVVRPLMFAPFAEAVQDTLGMKSPNTFEAKLKRNRILRQVTFYAGSAAVQLTGEDLTRMPIPAARVVLRHIDNIAQPAGKIVRAGDGIDKAIVFELGTPIPVGQGKPPIKELEFIAKTYGDVEDVLSAPTTLQQTITLITVLGKPLGTSAMALPSWAVNQITMDDGSAIMQHVLPLFTESPEDS